MTTATQAQTTAEIEPAAGSGPQTETIPTTGAEEETIVATATPAETSGEAGEEIAPIPIIFEIVPAESEARFLIDEVLLGSPKTVVVIRTS